MKILILSAGLIVLSQSALNQTTNEAATAAPDADQAATSVDIEMPQEGCAEGVPNFNWEACESAAAPSPDCAKQPANVRQPAIQSEVPITRDGYDPETDAPMEMRAVHRTEDGCAVIELTSGETVPVPQRETSRNVLVVPADKPNETPTSPRT